MPTLFMNKIIVSVPENTVLEFPAKETTSDKKVCFHIGGVGFQTPVDVINRIPNSFFATMLASNLGSAATTEDGVENYVLKDAPFEDAELFPLIFDFMVRYHDGEEPELRTVRLGQSQSLALDKIEDFIFPYVEPRGTDRPASVTGRKFSGVINPETGKVQLAILPDYREDIDGTMEAMDGGQDFIDHECSDICTDPRFIQLVLDYRNSPNKKRHIPNAEMIKRLNEEYEIKKRLITRRVIRKCTIFEVERGMPFVVFGQQCEGEHCLEVITEIDRWFNQTVV